MKPGSRWIVGHVKSRAAYPELTWEPTNWRPEHKACSDRTAQQAVIEKARLEGARAERDGSFSPLEPAREPPLLPVSLPGPAGARGDLMEVRDALRWPAVTRDAPPWLVPFLDLPQSASVPLAMTPVHPDAVGSYGAEAVAWIERRRGITARWWQALALVRQLEHDADGQLVWRTVVESAPRRAGKSERLRSLALWRMEHGCDLFEPDQIVVHVGRDLGIVREVQERVWNWCELQDWDVRRGNGKEVVTHPNGARWLAKSQHGAYGFDVHLGLADECWDVDPGAISEGIEPATMDRKSAQLVLTSTSHRLATSLMKRRISSALATDDGKTLLLLWGMEPGADIFDVETWRAASPWWTDERRDMIADKLREAQEADPEIDDPDPVGSWAHQYLNRWDLKVRKVQRGNQVTTEETWAELTSAVRLDKPNSAAIEGWWGDGVTLALAWKDGERTVVTASDHTDLASAVAALRATSYAGLVTVGASLTDDPALKGVQVRKGEGRVLAAVLELQRLMAEGVVRHDGSKHLAGQVLGVRTLPGADGQRIVSTSRADAIKAVVWAIGRARSRMGKPRILLPSNV